MLTLSNSTKVTDFVSDALTACDTRIQETNFTVETVIDPNLPPIRGDRAALKQVMENLITNAIKYDGRNRWARISAKTWIGKQRSEVRISVEDRGPGVGKVDIDHIFEPFYRGHEAVAAQVEGSGVGLSLVKQIVEAHSGKVTVKSTPGAGSVFTLHFPVATEPEDAGNEVKEAS